MFRSSLIARVLLVVGLTVAIAPSIASAGGRTFKLATVAKRGGVALRAGEQRLTIRAPKNTELQRATGGLTQAFAPVQGKTGKAGTTLYPATPGRYFAEDTVTSAAVSFSVSPAPGPQVSLRDLRPMTTTGR